MNGVPRGGVPLGGARPLIPEILVYPIAQVGIYPDGMATGDATHHLRITLPANGREIRIPFNPRAIGSLAQQCEKALGDLSRNFPPQEGNE